MKLENEYDLQKASLFERKLRLMIDENPDLKPIRKRLRDLIKDYEDREWADIENISDSKVEESDKAEEIIEYDSTGYRDNFRATVRGYNTGAWGDYKSFLLLNKYPGLSFTSSKMRQIYSAIIPKENNIKPEKKEIIIIVDVQPGKNSPQ